MKVRSAEEFVDAVAEEVKWRQLEISVIDGLVASANPGSRGVLCRSAVVMLYAHWEGFVKTVSEALVRYIHHRRVPIIKLLPCFSATHARHFVKGVENTRRIARYIELVTASRAGDVRWAVPVDAVVDTESNLSSEVFFDILTTLGLDRSVYDAHEALIDEALLRKRNPIAHGGRVPVTLADYESIRDGVRECISLFRNQVENAVVTEAFLQASASSPNAAP